MNTVRFDIITGKQKQKKINEVLDSIKKKRMEAN